MGSSLIEDSSSSSSSSKLSVDALKYEEKDEKVEEVKEVDKVEKEMEGEEIVDRNANILKLLDDYDRDNDMILTKLERERDLEEIKEQPEEELGSVSVRKGVEDKKDEISSNEKIMMLIDEFERN